MADMNTPANTQVTELQPKPRPVSLVNNFRRINYTNISRSHEHLANWESVPLYMVAFMHTNATLNVHPTCIGADTYR